MPKKHQLQPASPKDRDYYVNRKQAAQILGVHIDTIKRWCHEGKIRFFQKERTVLIPRSEIFTLSGGPSDVSENEA